MTQKIRAINIANNTFKSFVFDSTVSNLINAAAVAYSTANAANALVQAANTLVVSQTLQIANAAPTINTVSITDSSYNVLDDTAANTGGAYLRVTGSGFQSGAIVMVGTSNTALSTTFVDSNTLRAQIGAIASGTYPVYVVNTNGGTAIRVNALTVSSSPVWGTGSTLANVTSNTVFSTTLSANSDSSVTYANTTILPTGTTLLSNGYFYGSISVGSETTYSFDVKATDAENQDTTRTFSLTAVMPVLTGTTSVTYLIIAGGGGGGVTRGGGGGAGGLLNSNTPVTPGTPYTVTVGAGGFGGIYGGGAAAKGGNSSFAGIPTTGGGYGFSRTNSPTAASPGGSGGGGGADDKTAGTGISGQGYPGGEVTAPTPTFNYPWFVGGGGGGAGGAGTNASALTNTAGPGGQGSNSSITGTPVTYAGGGGGGGGPTSAPFPSGSGGPGGGGAGGNQTAGTNATVNTGSGGGGGGDDRSGGNGGSGRIIIAYPTASRTATTTGTVSYTIDSNNNRRVYDFTGSGTITF